MSTMLSTDARRKGTENSSGSTVRHDAKVFFIFIMIIHLYYHFTLQVPAKTEGLSKLPYPAPDATGPALASMQPCKIEYKLPSYVVVETQPEVSFWDDSIDRWSQENISDLVWDSATRKISFYSLRTASYSLTQPRILEFPYQYWIFRPKSSDEVELHLKTTRFEILFSISNEGVYLIGPMLPELAGLIYDDGNDITEDNVGQSSPRSPSARGVKASPAGRVRRVYQDPVKLLLDLKHSGINIMPEDRDDLTKYPQAKSDCHLKDSIVEKKAYADFADVSLKNDVIWSIHNKTKGTADRAVVRVRPNPLCEVISPFDPENDGDYKTCVFSKDKVCFAKGTDLKPNFDECGPTHTTLVLCFGDEGGAVVVDSYMSDMSTAKLVENVRRMASALRLLSFG